MFSRFLSKQEVPFHLVGGNHDARMKYLPCSITRVDAYDLGDIRVIHDPKDATPGPLHLSGHWHPVVKIKDGKRTSLRLPCFLLRGNTLVLPSFGSFTGGAIITREKDDRIFIPLREDVIELPETVGM